MTQYLLSVHHVTGESMPTSPEEVQPIFEAVERFKPVTVAALATAYETAVDETKRESVARRTR